VLFCLPMFCHYFTSEFSMTCQDPITLCMVKPHAGSILGLRLENSGGQPHVSGISPTYGLIKAGGYQ
jgi:hypothetical protein